MVRGECGTTASKEKNWVLRLPRGALGGVEDEVELSRFWNVKRREIENGKTGSFLVLVVR